VQSLPTLSGGIVADSSTSGYCLATFQVENGAAHDLNENMRSNCTTTVDHVPVDFIEFPEEGEVKL